MRPKERKDLGAASETVVHQGDAKSFDAFILRIITTEDVIVCYSLNYDSSVNGCHVYSERRLAGGEEAQRRQAPGGTLAEKTLLTVIIVTVVNAVIETAGMTVK